MLEIIIPETELFDEEKEQFVYKKAQPLRLEHSLISISKWESKWQKPFLEKNKKSTVETVDYIRCMTLNNVDPACYRYLTNENINSVADYIESPMTATTIKRIDKKQNSEIATSEIIYYWMVALNIPFECEKWHLNRLLMLISVCSIKNQPPKKMSRNEILARNKALNAERRKLIGSKG